jgi:hypothetical protein
MDVTSMARCPTKEGKEKMKVNADLVKNIGRPNTEMAYCPVLNMKLNNGATNTLQWPWLRDPA